MTVTACRSGLSFYTRNPADQWMHVQSLKGMECRLPLLLELSDRTVYRLNYHSVCFTDRNASLVPSSSYQNTSCESGE